MKTFRLFHVSTIEHNVCHITVKFNDINEDPTVSSEEKLTADQLNIGQSMIVHYGSNPVKTGTLIRLS